MLNGRSGSSSCHLEHQKVVLPPARRRAAVVATAIVIRILSPLSSSSSTAAAAAAAAEGVAHSTPRGVVIRRLHGGSQRAREVKHKHAKLNYKKSSKRTCCAQLTPSQQSHVEAELLLRDIRFYSVRHQVTDYLLLTHL